MNGFFSDGATLLGVTQERIFSRAGEYQVSLRVTDDDGLTHQTVESTVSVIESNRPPVMVGDQSFQAMQNQDFEFTLNGATDPESDSLTYFVANAPNSGALSGCLNNTGQLTCTYRPASDFVGQVVFSYKANDGQRNSETMSVVTIDVVYYNERPIAPCRCRPRGHFRSSCHLGWFGLSRSRGRAFDLSLGTSCSTYDESF